VGSCATDLIHDSTVAIQPSLRDSNGCGTIPGVETPGYFGSPSGTSELGTSDAAEDCDVPDL